MFLGNIAVLAIAMHLASCSSNDRSLQRSADLPVYRAILKLLAPPAHRTLLVADSTSETIGQVNSLVRRARGNRWVFVALPDLLDSTGGPHRVDSETVQNFGDANFETRALPRDLADDPATPLTHESALRFYSPPGVGDRASYWRAFHRRFPLAIGKAYLSAIGYNQSATEAVVFTEVICDSCSAAGTLILLVHGDSTWRILATRPVGPP